MLTRKDFKAVAKIIADNTIELDDDIHNHWPILPRNTVIYELADYFAIQNSRFDRQKFLDACGLNT